MNSKTYMNMKKSWIIICLLLAFSLVSGCASTSAYRLNGTDQQASTALNNLEQIANQTGEYAALVEYAYAVWFLNNDHQKAIEYWLKAKEKSQKTVEADMGLAMVYRLVGNVEEAHRLLVSVVQQDPSGPYAEIALGVLVSEKEENSKHITDVAVPLEKMFANPGLSYTSRRFINTMLVFMKEEQGDLKMYKDYESQLGHIYKHSLIGPFGQFGVLDNEKVYEPEKDWAVKKEYKHQGKTIKRIDVDYNVASITPDELYDNSGVVYNVSYIKLDKDSDVVFSISSSANSSIYVDGIKTVNLSFIGNYPMGTPKGAVHLKAGWHKVLVKFGDNFNRANGMLFACDTKGQPVISEMRSNLDGMDNVAEPVGTQLVNVPDSTVEYWEKKVKQSPDFYNLFFLVHAYSNDSQYTKINIAVEKMLAINSNFSFLYSFRAMAASDDPTFPEDMKLDRARADMLKALELDDKNVLARLYMAAYYSGLEQIEAALAELKILQKQLPEHYLVDYLLLSIYSSKGWTKEKYEAIEQALSKNMRDKDLVDAAYKFYLGRIEFDKAFEMAKQTVKLNRSSLALAYWYENKGQYDLAIKAYEEAIKWKDNEINNHLMLANLYQNIGQFDKALEIAERMAKRSPLDHSLYRTRADLYEFLGDKKTSMKILEGVLKNNKGDFNLRRTLRFYQKKIMLDEYSVDGLEVIKKFENDNWKPASTSTAVLDECIYKIFEDGSRMTRVHMIDQVNTKDALVKFGEINLPDSVEFYQLRAIKPDGRILMPEYIEGKSSVSIPNLEIGDYVEQDYVRGVNFDTTLTNGRMYFERFYFVNNRPTYDSRVALIVPENRKVNILELNYNLNKATVETKNGTTATWYRNQKIDQFIPEPMMPATEEFLPMIHIDEDIAWEEIRDLYRQRLARFKKPTPALEKFAFETTKGIKDEYRKVEKIFYAVTDLIDGEGKDFSFNAYASHIFELKEGNRLLLISTLLKILGIESEYVLVRPKNIAEIKYNGANTRLYSDPVLRVRLKDGRALFLDADYKESVFDAPSPMLLGSQALVLNGEELFITLPTKTSASETKELKLDVKLSDDGSAECIGMDRINGYYSVSMRKYLKQIPADKVNQFFEMVLNKAFPGITIIEAQMLNLDDSSKPLEIMYHFTVDQYAKLVDNQLRLPSAFFKRDLAKSYIKVHERKLPLLINSIKTGHNVSTIYLPKGYTIGRTPENQVIEDKFGEYRLEVDMNSQVIKYTRDYTVPIQKVALDEYTDFYKFCAEVDQLEREEIMLVQE